MGCLTNMGVTEFSRLVKRRSVSKRDIPEERDMKSLQAFITKFNNDWSLNTAAALAYNLQMAIIPIAIATLAILGLVIGT